MKKILIPALTICMCICANTSMAQNWVKNLGEKAANAGKNAIERNVENKVEEGVNNAFNGNNSNRGNNQRNNNQAQEEETNSNNQSNNNNKPAPKPKDIEQNYLKSDFVSGDQIIFEDLMLGEQMGEFPSMWDLLEGNAEVAKIDGQTAIYLESPNTNIMPLMENPKNYLTQEYTIEFDYFQGDRRDIGNDKILAGSYFVNLMTEDDVVVEIFFNEDAIYWHFEHPTTNNTVHGELSLNNICLLNQMNHFALSFNKRALKTYINGTRVMNIPNVKQAHWFSIKREHWEDHGGNYINNIRVAQGAVPLYDRLSTDGKIVSYSITFDTGKSTIKPESMTEINRIAKLMNEKPELKFEVQGHCDKTGNDAVNQKLSQERAEAIVNKLVELGISKNRLSALGKGSSEPIADNSSAEGKAKNRRVEFVKK